MARDPNQGIITTVRLPVRQIDQLRALAKDNERSVSAEIRLAVRKHLEQKGGKR